MCPWNKIHNTAFCSFVWEWGTKSAKKKCLRTPPHTKGTSVLSEHKRNRQGYQDNVLRVSNGKSGSEWKWDEASLQLLSKQHLLLPPTLLTELKQ